MYDFIKREEGSISFEEVAQVVRKHIADHDWKSVLLLPPDITRIHSGAGPITALYYEELTKRGASVKVLPALGTHLPMTEEQLRQICGSCWISWTCSVGPSCPRSSALRQRWTIRSG